MGLSTRIYNRLPVIGQHAAISTFGLYWHWLRFGPGFKQFVRDYQARDRFTAEQWEAWQSERLKHLLAGCLQVPYYADTWGDRERAAASEGRLADLPLLDKGPLRDDAQRFLRPDMKPGRTLITSTSGSTGTPIVNHWTWKEYRDSRAVREVRSAGWAGVSYRDPRATFSGRLVVPDPDSKGPFHRYNRVERQVYYSAFHLGPGTARQYVDALHTHQTRWLTGYAVSYYLLAELILEQGLKVPDSLQAIITTSEKMTDAMREVMERAYRCRVYEEYSTVENCIFVSECEAGSLHISPDVSVVEILRPDGTPCDPDEPGEVVATCLMRNYQPLIRYRVGDVAAWSSQPCDCGRSMPVLKEVVGRLEDVLIGPDGRRMVRFHGLFVDQPSIREGQVIQETISQIRVKVVTTDDFDEKDVQEIQRRVHQRMGAVEVIVEPVSEIPRTTSGKFKAVVSHVLNGDDEAERLTEHVAH